MRSRYSPRIDVNLPVTLSSDGLIGHGQVLNLSIPGCLLETGFKLKKGQMLQLRLAVLNSQQSLRVGLAVVRWTTAPRAGIEFIRMSDADQVSLRTLVSPVPLPEALSAWSPQ